MGDGSIPVHVRCACPCGVGYGIYLRYRGTLLLWYYHNGIRCVSAVMIDSPRYLELQHVHRNLRLYDYSSTPHSDVLLSYNFSTWYLCRAGAFGGCPTARRHTLDLLDATCLHGRAPLVA